MCSWEFCGKTPAAAGQRRAWGLGEFGHYFSGFVRSALADFCAAQKTQLALRCGINCRLAAQADVAVCAMQGSGEGISIKGVFVGDDDVAVVDIHPFDAGHFHAGVFQFVGVVGGEAARLVEGLWHMRS